MAKVTKVEKATEIKNAHIQFVSLVGKAANQRTFLLKKEEGGKVTFSNYGRIVKTDAQNHYVTGIVYEPMTEDSQGDYMEEAEIVKAAYYFAKNGDKVDLQHSFEPLDGAAVVENWVAKADFKIDDEEIHKGTWLMTVEVTDTDIWDKIEKGDITGFSMGGVGEYSEEDVDLSSIEKTIDEKTDKKGLLTKLAAVLGLNVVEKGAMAELYEERSKGTLFWNAFNSLEEILYKYDAITGRWQYETNEDKVRECLEDFNQIITSILTGKESIIKAIQNDRPIEKAGKKMSGKNREMLANIYESLGTFLKEFDDQEEQENEKKEDKEVTKQEVEEIVAVAIKKSMGGNVTQKDAKAVEKSESKATEITAESIEKMVEVAITKALEPQQEESITVEQVQDMISAAVEKAISPVLKSKGLPSNLNDSSVEKSASQEHYLHGIL